MIPELTESYKRQSRQKWDRFYALPDIIQCFVDRAINEMKNDHIILPRTINRSVTILSYDSIVEHEIPYEAIEDDIVGELDKLQELQGA